MSIYGRQAISHFWTIEYDMPITYRVGDNEYTNRKTDRAGVVADTLDDAIAKAKAIHPDVHIWCVKHAGKITHE